MGVPITGTPTLIIRRLILLPSMELITSTVDDKLKLTISVLRKSKGLYLSIPHPEHLIRLVRDGKIVRHDDDAAVFLVREAL